MRLRTKWNNVLKYLYDLLGLTNLPSVDDLLQHYYYDSIVFSFPPDFSSEFTRIADRDEFWLVGVET